MQLENFKKFIWPRGHQKGFTLVEMLTYIAILGLIGSIASTLFISFLDVYTKIKVKREILTTSRLAMDDIIFETKHAKSIYTTTSAASQLSLETVLNVPVDENTTYIDYYLDNGIILKKREGQAPEQLTSSSVDVTGLVFTYLGTSANPSSVRINISARYRANLVAPKHQSATDIVSSVSLR